MDDHGVVTDVKTCVWSQSSHWDDDNWSGDCGAEWSLFEGTPKENNMNYCPECGGKLVEEKCKEQDNE